MKTFGSRVFLLILIPTVVIFLLITFTGLYYYNTILKEQAISKKTQVFLINFIKVGHRKSISAQYLIE